MTPTLPAARIHQNSSTTHDSALPASDSIDSPVAALSMKIAAFRIASSSASPHNAGRRDRPGRQEPEQRKAGDEHGARHVFGREPPIETPREDGDAQIDEAEHAVDDQRNGQPFDGQVRRGPDGFGRQGEEGADVIERAVLRDHGAPDQHDDERQQHGEERRG